MAYLIVNASPRAKGNSDALSRLAERDIREEGSEARTLALREMELRECTGCMRCVFHDERCRLDDDIYRILEAVRDCEGLVLVAPTYVTTIPAMLKLVLDRFLLIPSYRAASSGRSALTIPVASPIDWFDFQVPLLNMAALGLGFSVLDTIIMRGAGPGEVLLDARQVQRFRDGVARLVAGHRREPKDTVSCRCPVCFDHLLERVGGMRFRCAVCHVPATLTEEGFSFRAAEMGAHRWMPERLKDHFENWIRATRGMYRSRLREIMMRRKELLGSPRSAGQG